MADDRTPEQRQADEALDEAISRVYREYGGQAVPVEWVVCLAAVDSDDDGQLTEYHRLMPHGSMPLHHATGLVREILRRLDRDSDDVDDE